MLGLRHGAKANRLKFNPLLEHVLLIYGTVPNRPINMDYN